MSPLYTTERLAADLGDVKVVDASWRMPGMGRAEDDYRERHIPGAVFFDIDRIADPDTDLPHMLPSAEAFAAAAGALGIIESDRVVVYDDQGLFSAPRVWWTFRTFGHQNVFVLNGGLKKWLSEGRPVDTATVSGEARSYKARFDDRWTASAADVRSAIETRAAIIVDARPAARFSGVAPEPRAGLVAGAMPGAINAPASDIVAADGTLRPPAALRAFFTDAGVDLTRPLLTTCGSGVTAALLALALESLGVRDWRLYDGSWAEWGKETNDRVAYPVITGGV